MTRQEYQAQVIELILGKSYYGSYSLDYALSRYNLMTVEERMAMYQDDTPLFQKIQEYDKERHGRQLSDKAHLIACELSLKMALEFDPDEWAVARTTRDIVFIGEAKQCDFALSYSHVFYLALTSFLPVLLVKEVATYIEAWLLAREWCKKHPHLALMTQVDLQQEYSMHPLELEEKRRDGQYTYLVDLVRL